MRTRPKNGLSVHWRKQFGNDKFYVTEHLLWGYAVARTERFLGPCCPFLVPQDPIPKGVNYIRAFKMRETPRRCFFLFTLARFAYTFVPKDSLHEHLRLAPMGGSAPNNEHNHAIKTQDNLRKCQDQSLFQESIGVRDTSSRVLTERWSHLGLGGCDTRGSRNDLRSPPDNLGRHDCNPVEILDEYDVPGNSSSYFLLAYIRSRLSLDSWRGQRARAGVRIYGREG